MRRSQMTFKTSEKDRAYARAYYYAHKEQMKIARKNWVTKNPEVVKEYAHNRNQRLKEEVIRHYGAQCECCTITEIEFLALDHINGGGSAHRRQLKKEGTGNFYLWIINEGFPLGFRTLCHNCNFAIGKYGFCPHTQQPAITPSVGSWHRR